MKSLEPLWYKDAVIYELHVRAFFDSRGDGQGDFAGMTQKLDYLRDLGVTAIWLLPFYPSPGRDDGYDIADYRDIHPQYGTLDDFRIFLDAAHARDLQVITELVINHTSDQHPWFQRARRAPPGSRERDFYVWSDTPEKYREARIIFKDFEPSNWTYDRVAKAYYWHRFYSHQPDLNFDNPAVWEAIFPLLDFWMEMGVDGMRLDAVPYLFEREGTNCENLPQTHEFLKALRRHVDERFPNRMLLAEANQWPEDSVAYFGSGDECHMAFHFPLMPRLFMSIQREDRFPIIDIMDQTPAIPANCQWAVFLRNHDELTLEMVTDEERDYMYRVYARELRSRINLGIRRRLAPLLGNNRRRIELMNSLLFSMPGAPVIYYGDEIGMGDNIYLGDRNGVRTPMQWSADRNAGFSRANPQKLYLPVIIDPEYHYESVNVDAQQSNASSLLWWTKRLVDMRKRYKALSRGQLEFLHPENRKILAFLRTYEEECLLIVVNLSRFVQYVELDLSRFHGVTPVELFGMTPFPAVGTLPYLLTLGPHSFYWLSLSGRPADGAAAPAPDIRPAIPVIHVNGAWEQLLVEDANRLARTLPRFLDRRWPLPEEDVVRRAWIGDVAQLEQSEPAIHLVSIEFESRGGQRATTLVPLSVATGQAAEALLTFHADFAVARLSGDAEGVLHDASCDPMFASALLACFDRSQPIRTRSGALLTFTKSANFAPLRGSTDERLLPRQVRGEQFNTSVNLGNRLVLKIYRHIEEGPHPEVELGSLLADSSEFANVAPLVGVIDYRPARGATSCVGVLHAAVPHEADAWQRAMDELSGFLERCLAGSEAPPAEYPRLLTLMDWIAASPPPLLVEALGHYLDEARLLGQRTAELHAALGAASENPEMAPEPFTPLYQRSLYQAFRSLRLDVLDQLRRDRGQFPAATRERAESLLARGEALLAIAREVVSDRLTGVRMRCHGDYNLSQLLHTGKDFVIIDLEGPPRATLGERRIKRSPLRDVASLLRSFDYAARSSLFGLESGRGRIPGAMRFEDRARLRPWSRIWTGWAASSFLRTYLRTCEERGFQPASPASVRRLLPILIVERALSELLSELRYRPGWVDVPLDFLVEVLDDRA